MRNIMQRSSVFTVLIVCLANYGLGKAQPFKRPLPYAGEGSCEAPRISENGETFVRCLGPEIYMLPGTVLDSNMLLDNPFPNKSITVIHQQAQLLEKIDDVLRPVPLNELYVHHIVPNPGFIFGQGAEIRGSMTRKPLPRPYALHVDGTETGKEAVRLANLQVLNTIGVPEDKLQESVECWCGFPRELATKGSLFCCTQNPTTANSTYHTYQLEYNVTYRDVHKDDVFVSQHVFDITEGKIEYNIVEPLGPETVHVKAVEMAFDHGCPQKQTVKVVRCTGHQHIGSIAMHLYNAETNETICSSIPKYGKQLGVPGDELGYVVAIEDGDRDPAYEISPGTKIRLESHYTGTKKHLGVMGFLNTFLAGWEPCDDTPPMAYDRALQAAQPEVMADLVTS